MQNLVFLDIDDVLLPWDFQSIQEIIDHSGFNDWKRVSHPYMKQVSFDLLNTVWNAFQPHLYWLTTWELHGEGANTLFSRRLGLENLQEIPFIGDYYKTIQSGWGRISEPPMWWKSSILNRFVDDMEEIYRIVWIDNEIDDQIRNGNVHQSLIDDPNILKISPYPCLTKAQIDEAVQWLEPF